MNWLKTHWRWTVLNIIAVVILLITLTRGSLDIDNTRTFDPMLESGKWAVRFLLFSLAMTPLNTLFGWRAAVPLRKPAGLWAFGFAVLHFVLLIVEPSFGGVLGGIGRLALPLSLFMTLGILGLLTLTALAATSYRWAMQRLGKNWKRLHRLVYIAGGLVVVHAILATENSKKMFIRDPQAITELQLYLVLLVILLVLRVPFVRAYFARLKYRRPSPALLANL